MALIHCGYGVVYVEEKTLDLTVDPLETNAAGVYTADIIVPARAFIWDIGVEGVALWNAGTSAAGIVGDVADPNGFFDAIDLKANDLLANESLSLADAGGTGGAYSVTNQWSLRRSTSERTITLEITTVGDAPTTGETILYVAFSKQPATFDRKYGAYAAT